MKNSQTGFPIRGRIVSGQFGQNGLKLHENYKINFLGAKQWGRHGGQPIRVLGGTASVKFTAHWTFTLMAI